LHEPDRVGFDPARLCAQLDRHVVPATLDLGAPRLNRFRDDGAQIDEFLFQDTRSRP
jgi:hypothetical protein